jgi:hypothetical protein
MSKRGAYLTTSGIEKGLPLCWEVTISGWDTEKESIVLFKCLCGYDWVVFLRRCVHLVSILVRDPEMHVGSFLVSYLGEDILYTTN